MAIEVIGQGPIFRVFSALAAGKSPAPVNLRTLSAMRAMGTADFQIVVARAGYVWDWRGITDAPPALLAPIVNSATDLLTSSHLRRVGQCADDRGCGWLFFDASRNRSRRWCSMEDCGNRAKARLHYSRRRTGKEPAKPD